MANGPPVFIPRTLSPLPSPVQMEGTKTRYTCTTNPLTDTGQSTVPLIREVLTRNIGNIQIVVGDFNLHLQRLLPQLTPHLVQLYNASMDLQYCPKHFKQSETVVLPKPGKKDLTIAKSYRPISLLDTLGKALESILAQRIAIAVEKHRLLPKGHLGGPVVSLGCRIELSIVRWRILVQY